MAEEKKAAAAAKSVKAAVLSDGFHGKAGDVVEVDESVAQSSPDLDPHPSAVAYREKMNAETAAKLAQAQAEAAAKRQTLDEATRIELSANK